MPSAPANPSKSTVIIPTPKLVVLSSLLNQAPESTDDVEYWIPLAWSVSAGARRLDSMVIRHDFGRVDPEATRLARLRDVTAPITWERQAELRMKDEDGDPSRLLMWGYLAEQSLRIGQFEESLLMTFRLDKHHFGNPLTSHPIWDTANEQRVNVETPLIWNPQRDVNGTLRIMPNRSSYEDVGDPDADPPVEARHWFYVLNPESLRTEEAADYQLQEPFTWTLEQAALSLCWWCNPDETYVENPDYRDIVGQLPADLMLKNQLQSYGKYLPDALDELLEPHGCGWWVEHTLKRVQPAEGEEAAAEDEPPAYTRHSRIRFYQRGQGNKVTLQRQRNGVKDINRTSVNDFAMTISVVELANVVQVFGDYEKREVTFPLVRGWDNVADSLNALDLERGQENANLNPWAGRKYVLNEAADYVGLRATREPAAYAASKLYRLHDRVVFGGEVWRCVFDQTASNSPTEFPADWFNMGAYVASSEVTEPYDLQQFFTADSLAVRRRRFLPCLSEHEDGDDAESNRFVLEWLDPNGGAAPVAWSETTQYSIGELVSYGGDVYSATEDLIGSESTPGEATEWQRLGPVTPAAWDFVTTYTYGDIVRYADTAGTRYYRCYNESTSGTIPVSYPQFWEEITFPFTGAKWVRWRSQFSVLEHECGILFESPRIPERLWTLFQMDPPRDRVRVTCTVEGDRRVQARATRRSDSPNNQDIVMTLYLEDKFQDAQVTTKSIFSGTSSHARNDTAACLTYAQTVRNVEDCAEMSTSVFIEGLEHPELRIGQLVTKIEGLNITLNTHETFNGSTARYPQIVGFNFDTQTQLTEVMLESFKRERIDPSSII